MEGLNKNLFIFNFNSLKQFILKVVLFLVISFLVDKVFIFVRDNTSKKEVDKRLEMILEGKMNKDILILGSSLGARNILAHRIEQQIGVSTYNLSYPGSNIDFHEFVLRQVLLNNDKPSLIILTIDNPSQFIENNTIVFRSDRLYPLVKYQSIRSELVEREHKSKLLSELFVLYTLKLSQFDLRKKKFSSKDKILSCGSMPLDFQNNYFSSSKNQGNISIDYSIYDEDVFLKNKFDSFVQICKKNKINLLIAFSPKYKEKSYKFIDRFEKEYKNDVFFVSYDTTNIIYDNKSFYHDKVHLLTKGAEFYTDEIIRHIKKVLD